MSRYVKGDRVSLDPRSAQAAGFAGVTDGTITHVDYEEVLVRPDGGGPFTARPFALAQVTVTREWIQAGQRVGVKGQQYPYGLVERVVYGGPTDHPAWYAVVHWDGQDAAAGAIPLARVRRLGLQEELAAEKTPEGPSVAGVTRLLAQTVREPQDWERMVRQAQASAVHYGWVPATMARDYPAYPPVEVTRAE